MPSLPDYRLFQIFKHWDKKEDLCKTCASFWEKLTSAERKEIHHNYEFEKDD